MAKPLSAFCISSIPDPGRSNSVMPLSFRARISPLGAPLAGEGEESDSFTRLASPSLDAARGRRHRALPGDERRARAAGARAWISRPEIGYRRGRPHREARTKQGAMRCDAVRCGQHGNITATREPLYSCPGGGHACPALWRWRKISPTGRYKLRALQLSPGISIDCSASLSSSLQSPLGRTVDGLLSQADDLIRSHRIASHRISAGPRFLRFPVKRSRKMAQRLR